MPTMNCPNCDGTGYEEHASGESIICARCDGTGTLFVDDVPDAVEGEHWPG